MITRTEVKNISGTFFDSISSTLLSLLLVILLVGMALGVANVGYELLKGIEHLFLDQSLHKTLKDLVINVLIVLAVLELLRTVRAYFSEGRLKVTYVVDTALVVVVTEIMGFWYREVEVKRVALAIALMLALMVVRILAIRFSPKRRELFDGL